MTTCLKCGRVLEAYDIGSGMMSGDFHVCTSKSPCTTHYACDCLKEKIAELEATIKTYCEETSRLNIDRNKLEAKIKEKDEEIQLLRYENNKMMLTYNEGYKAYKSKNITLQNDIISLRKALEPFANWEIHFHQIFHNTCLYCIAKHAWKETGENLNYRSDPK